MPLPSGFLGGAAAPVAQPPIPQQAPAAAATQQQRGQPQTSQTRAALAGRVLSAFAGVKGTTRAVRGIYFTPGKYITRVDKTSLGEVRGKGVGIFVHFTIMRVIEEVPGKSLRVGECPQICLKSWDANYFQRETVSLIGGMFNMTDDQVKALDVDECKQVLLDTETALSNIIACVQCRTITLQSSNKPFDLVSVEGAIEPADALGFLTPEERAKYFAPGYLEGMSQQMAQPAA